MTIWPSALEWTPPTVGQGTTTFSEAKNVTLFGQATSDLKPIFFP